MEDVTRKRIMRKLERLPEEQLYQVLDYIEFLEAKYARQAARKPDPFQQFAERVEDQMRVRSLAPKAMRGTMRLMSTAGRVLDGVRELGRDLVEGPRPSTADSAGKRSSSAGLAGGAARASLPAPGGTVGGASSSPSSSGVGGVTEGAKGPPGLRVERPEAADAGEGKEGGGSG